MKKFKAGDKVKLNQPMHQSMEEQVPYKKYYDVVVTDTMDYAGNELQTLGIDGIKGMVSSEFFDLYDDKVELEKEYKKVKFDFLSKLDFIRDETIEKIENRYNHSLFKKHVVVCPHCGNSDLKTEYGRFICKCGNAFYISNCNVESID